MINLYHILKLCLPNHHTVRRFSSASQNLRFKKIWLSPENFWADIAGTSGVSMRGSQTCPPFLFLRCLPSARNTQVYAQLVGTWPRGWDTEGWESRSEDMVLTLMDSGWECQKAKIKSPPPWAAWVAQRFSATFGPGHDPWDPGSSPTSGSLHGACFSLCLCLCLSLSMCVSHKKINKIFFFFF